MKKSIFVSIFAFGFALAGVFSLAPRLAEAAATDWSTRESSTTKEVTQISGRGFGLNIVKTKVESLGGSVKVESQVLKGTRFILEIPLTLAVFKVLFVKVGPKLYAISLANVERLIHVKKEDIKGMLNYEAIVF